METETEIKEQQWTKSISSASSSRSSSITSDSSDGHFDIRHFPLPKPSLSASEAQKQRDSHQIYNSSVSSYTGSSWSHLVDSSGYDSNRIPSSVFSSKTANTTDWSIASNESLFSIHDGNFCISTRDDHGLARMSEIPRSEEPVHEKTEINPAHLPSPLPPVKKPKEYEKETITEKSDSEIDDNEYGETIELERNDEHEEEEEDDDDDDMIEDFIEAEVLVKIETENTKEKKVMEVVKENKPEDASSVVSHSPSISCHSDTSTNSIGSFVFPVLQKEDEVIKTPSMEIKGNASLKRTTEYHLPQSPMRPPQLQPQAQPYSESSMVTEFQPQSQPQRTVSEKSESQTQSPKASKSGWFSCFKCPSKCKLFK